MYTTGSDPFVGKFYSSADPPTVLRLRIRGNEKPSSVIIIARERE